MNQLICTILLLLIRYKYFFIAIRQCDLIEKLKIGIFIFDILPIIKVIMNINDFNFNVKINIEYIIIRCSWTQLQRKTIGTRLPYSSMQTGIHAYIVRIYYDILFRCAVIIVNRVYIFMFRKTRVFKYTIVILCSHSSITI